MLGGFEVVKRKRQRKRKVNSVNIDLESHSDFQANFSKKLENALEEFQSSRFCFELLHAIDNSLTSNEISCIPEILCFGLGNFLESKSSLHQLAALVKFQKKYKSIINVYDPIFTLSEIQILEKLNFGILLDNEEGKRKVNASQGILVFLPHCPMQLTNNFLWANWNISLCNFIIVANSFSRIIEDNTEKVLQESANYILKIHPKTVEISLEDCYHINNIFNDTSVHYFCPKDLNANFFLKTLGEEPQYSNNIELITKNFKILDITNE